MEGLGVGKDGQGSGDGCGGCWIEWEWLVIEEVGKGRGSDDS